MSQTPTLRQLHYFLALVEHSHFGRAAEACFVSQSAFSHAIREMEDALGTQLVDRTNRSVTITNTGKDIAVQARLVLQDVETLVDTARATTAPLSGRLTLGSIPTIAPYLLPRALPKLRKAHPDLQLYLREGQSEHIVQELHDGNIDVILLALPYPMRNVTTLELFDDPFHLAYRRGTRLIDPKNFQVNRLNADSVLLLEEGHCLRDHALSACKIASRDSVNNFAASSLATLVEMVRADLGVTFIPEMAIRAGSLKGTGISTLPMPKGNLRKIGLGWRKGSGREAEFRLLGKLLQQEWAN
ncbi:MAG: hydrogen peroxide-inducible genes activator [Gammaproteobacteria bacterium]|nr:hydrogen peroxide-inducible genes activator [Gammaproteobacteria bacterium]NND53453.1 hydrogen peroxide-inducible genes activator [Gammaproteobacteria bacterium]